MMSRIESRKKIIGDSGHTKLLNEIGAISNALYLDKTQSRGSISAVGSRSKSVEKSHFPEPKSKLKDGNKDSLEKDKKSVWSWKSLKALTHIRNRRFDCCFSLKVHSIEGLPPSFDGFNFVVHWRRRVSELMTRPVKVSQGIAEFEEQLTHTCSVYGSRNGPHHSAKYEAKHFLLYASVYGNPALDLGKHRIDLTRLLPLTLEELEDEKCSGKWTTSFRLLGKAKGAIMNVSFGYLVMGNNTIGPAANREVARVSNFREKTSIVMKSVGEFGQIDEGNTIHRGGSGSVPIKSSSSHLSVEHIKDLHEVLPISKFEFSDSVNILYQKLDEKDDYIDEPKLDVPSESLGCVKLSSYSFDSAKGNVGNECEVSDFFVTEHGIEFSSKNQSDENDTKSSAVDNPNVAEVALEGATKHHDGVEEIDSCKNEFPLGDCNCKENEICTKEGLMKELECALNDASDVTEERLDYEEDESETLNEENAFRIKSNYGASMKRSRSLDDIAESVASEFMDMLGIEHSPFGLSSESDPESPRERLLRQFEEDVLSQGCSLFHFDIEGEQTEYGYNIPTESYMGTFSEEFHYSSTMQDAQMPKVATEPIRNKTRVSTMEDLETESLMHEWGLNEKAFHCSPPSNSSGFGSPIDLPPESPSELPPLGERLGPFIQTTNGGFLRSMNPALFRNAKSEGSLIMQVSNPVVVPAEMGSDIMEILQHLASVGIEKLSMQANKMMPLEDITGETMQQMELEAVSILEGPERQGLLYHEGDVDKNAFTGLKRSKKNSSGSKSRNFEAGSVGNEMDSEFASLEDLAPLAMEKIESLSIEGLRMQSGMSGVEATSNVSSQSIGEFSAFEGKRVNIGGSLGVEGAGGLQLLDIKDNGDDVDGLMGLSLTLDEWMRLDSGEIDDEDQISERTSKILAAHHATSLDLIRARSKGNKKHGKGYNRKCGFLANNFTVALMVQLRDPLRNYEPVGTPMLALIQVERVFVPPKPKIYSTVSNVSSIKEEEESESSQKRVEESKENIVSEEKPIPQFKITEVNVAGLKTEPDTVPGKKQLWGSSSQQQSGSRWLLANGMGKKNKHPILKSKAITKASTPATGNTLWGISSRVLGIGAKKK